MAVCKKCGNKLGNTNICSSCGAKQSNRKMLLGISIIIIVIFVGVIIGISIKNTKQTIQNVEISNKKEQLENMASGKYPYNLGGLIGEILSATPIQSKWHDSTCYCSQFVWRSWCAANIGFDFSGANPWILPVDFQLTSQTKKIASYKNK